MISKILKTSLIVFVSMIFVVLGTNPEDFPFFISFTVIILLGLGFIGTVMSMIIAVWR